MTKKVNSLFFRVELDVGALVGGLLGGCVVAGVVVTVIIVLSVCACCHCQCCVQCCKHCCRGEPIPTPKYSVQGLIRIAANNYRNRPRTGNIQQAQTSACLPPPEFLIAQKSIPVSNDALRPSSYHQPPVLPNFAMTEMQPTAPALTEVSPPSYDLLDYHSKNKLPADIPPSYQSSAPYQHPSSHGAAVTCPTSGSELDLPSKASHEK